jgi:aminopeptidase N
MHFTKYYRYKYKSDQYCTFQVERDWRLDQQFVLDAHQYALAADASKTTRPMTKSVFSPAEINSLFDTIAYEKGQ